MNFNFEAIKSTFDMRDYHICAKSNLPAAYSCPITLEIKNQGQKPTCVAHATSSLLEYHHESQTGKHERFSTEFIYGLRLPTYAYGDGMMIRDALNTLKSYGDPYERDFPGNNDVSVAQDNVTKHFDTIVDLAYPHRISTYYRCDNNDGIKTALMSHGPVIASMKTYIKAYLKKDVYTWDEKDDYGHHCVLIVGWNETGWIVQNSWGSSYGGDGKFILPFNYKLTEAWGITDSVQDDTDIKKPNAFIKFISTICNKLVNFFRK